MSEKRLDLEELGLELGELRERVVALEIRDDHRNLIADAEGEFGALEGSATKGWSFSAPGHCAS